jgi:hypothetical protein
MPLKIVGVSHVNDTEPGCTHESPRRRHARLNLIYNLSQDPHGRLGGDLNGKILHDIGPSEYFVPPPDPTCGSNMRS